MASKEQELQELAELEELAKLEELAAKEMSTKSVKPEEVGMIEKATRFLNLPSGASRAAIAGAIEPLVGKDIVSTQEVTTGTVPDIYELSKRADFDLLNLTPGFVRNLAKLTGQEELVRKGVGMIGDVYTDPATYLAAPLKAVQVAGKVGPKALAAAKFGEVLLNPIGEGISAIGKGVSKVTPSKYSLMSAVSGVPKEAIATYAQNKKVIDQLDVGAAEELAQNAAEQAKNAVMQVKQQAGSALSQAAKEAGDKPIDIVDLKKQLTKMASAPEGALENKAAQETFAEMKSKIDQLLTFKEPIYSTQLDPLTLTAVNVPSGKTRVAEIPNQLTASQLFEMKQQIKDIGDLYGGKGGLLSKLASQNAPLVNKEFTTNLTGSIKKIDSMIDEATAGASKEARNQYAKLSSQARAADRYFSTPEKTLGTLSNLSTNAKAPARRIIKNVDESFGTDLEQTGKLIESAKYFNEPSIEALTGKGTTSTSRTLGGAAVGSALGSMFGGPTGAAIGAAVGSKAASPWALKNLYLPASEVASKAASYIPQPPSNIPPQVWLEMLRSQNKESEK